MPKEIKAAIKAAKWQTITVRPKLHRQLKDRAKAEGRKVRFIVERMLTVALREPPPAL